ncbi:cytochrome c peroxidase [Vibrio sp. RE88]|uniref:cytochrome-c peroxidase n=1 Tax=Vibrio sp. RE88 TaxID=2607610 RepID=UPI0014936A05|nr:cytochrome c peroxidase [Vibrio sp. RE88]NOH62616.1 cytochrome-c peroxidase [Vibrio sp. RE88]
MNLFIKALLPLLLWLPTTSALAESISAIQELGRHLFFDTQLSLKGNRSCALCHSPTHGWSNTFTKTININGEPDTLNTPSLLNISQQKAFSQTDPNRTEIEVAITTPMFSIDPLEMGLTPDLLLTRLKKSASYTELFEQAYADRDITLERVVKALEHYLTLIKSRNTRFHQYLAGNEQALTNTEQEGFRLFSSSRLQCSRCHGGSLLNQPEAAISQYQNTGLYGISRHGAPPHYPATQPGLRRHTSHHQDDGRFRIPSLINVANTGPWAHDGSVQSLTSVIDNYARGGRKTSYGPNQGDGFHHPNKSFLINGFSLTRSEKTALIAFLHSLSVEDDWTRYPFNSPFCVSNDKQTNTRPDSTCSLTKPTPEQPK